MDLSVDNVIKAFDNIHEKEKKNPLYFHSYEMIEKENRELKRTLTLLGKMIKEESIKQILSKKD